MSLPYSATVLVNWLPVTCMPSPESPAKRMTACSITSRLCLTGGTSASVDILVRTLRSSITPRLPPGEHGSVKRMRRCNERMASKTARRSRCTRISHRTRQGRERVYRAAMCLIQKEIRIRTMVTTTVQFERNIREGNGLGRSGLSGNGIGCRGCFQETLPIVDEQTKNCASE